MVYLGPIFYVTKIWDLKWSVYGFYTHGCVHVCLRYTENLPFCLFMTQISKPSGWVSFCRLLCRSEVALAFLAQCTVWAPQRCMNLIMSMFHALSILKTITASHLRAVKTKWNGGRLMRNGWKGGHQQVFWITQITNSNQAAWSYAESSTSSGQTSRVKTHLLPTACVERGKQG